MDSAEVAVGEMLLMLYHTACGLSIICCHDNCTWHELHHWSSRAAATASCTRSKSSDIWYQVRWY